MIKKFRRYQKLMMVIFGVLLLLTWLAGPAIERLGRAAENRVVGSIDGEKLDLLTERKAYMEINGLDELGVAGQLGIAERNTTHWLLLTREAGAAGLIGEGEDGAKVLDEIAQGMAQQYLQQDFQRYIELLQKGQGALEQELATLAEQVKPMIVSRLRAAGLNQEESEAALAKARGVMRLRSAYYSAPRVSDRAAIAEAKRQSDGAIIDYVVIPASSLAAQVPEPDAAALQAQFDAYKSLRPGEGEYGIGYLLGPRVKFEYLKLDRKAIESAIAVDPVEARKRYNQNRAQFPGDYSVERANVDAAIRGDIADRVMQEATSAFQRETQKLTRRLESDGRHKVLPSDWNPEQPRLEPIAQQIVEQVKSATGVTIPLPQVVILASKWHEASSLDALPEIGSSVMRQGGVSLGLSQVLLGAKELSGAGPLPVQAGVPVAENFFKDAAGNQYHVNLMAARGESAPDSFEEIRETVVQDYKRLKAFEDLKARATQIQQQAAAEDGLSQLATQFGTTADPTNPAAPGAIEVKRTVKVSRARADNGDIALSEDVRDAIADLAATVDPAAAPGSIPADRSVVVTPEPKQLSLVVARIQSASPLTIEDYRLSDVRFVQAARQKDYGEEPKDPFGLDALLQRHDFVSGSTRIKSEADLKAERADS